MTTLRDEALLIALTALGAATYLVSVWALLGRNWVRGLLKGAESTPKA